MINKEKHIIHKVIADVHVPNQETAFKLKDDMSVFLREHLFPIIEEHMSAISDNYENAIIRMDQLSIDLQFSNIQKIDSKQIKKEVSNAFQRSFADTLKVKEGHRLKTIENTQIILPIKSNLETFFFFLDKGKAPWWQPQLSTIFKEEKLKELTLQPGFIERLKILSNKAKVRQRLIYQFNDQQLTIIFKGTTLPLKQLSKLEKIFNKSPKTRSRFWKELITMYQRDTPKFEVSKYTELEEKDTSLLKIIAKGIIERSKITPTKESSYTIKKENVFSYKSSELKDESGIEKQEIKSIATEKTQLEEDGIYVSNAGVILLHPFLQSFFKRLKFLGEDSKLLAEKKTLAVHLLHYLSTKTLQVYESELLLEKFICGIPLEEPIERNIETPKELLTEAETLLKACLTNWTALKSNSPDALRATFLQRDGKLIFEEERYRLIVERKAEDILLDRIPWNINIIKLPWLDKLVFVEW